MKLAIMQPYFIPYIGYFQLINAVDVFVVYDNIQYTKKGWINRNRVLINQKDEYITLPLKKDSDFLDIMDRFLADSFTKERIRILRKIKEAYRKAPFFEQVYPLAEQILNFSDANLFNYLFHSIKNICHHLDIKTKLIVSSSLSINHELKSEQKVLAICEELGADSYINPIGGLGLYDSDVFNAKGVNLKFLKTTPHTYQQIGEEHVPFLSIIDVLMFNSPTQVKDLLNNRYTLI